MSTIENLFIRIFERKKWIVDQLKQHSELYDQSLASKCLINGIQPPSWLLQSAFKELKKEDLISGLLFPPPRPNYPTASCHNRPLFSENNVQYSATLYTGTCASKKDLNVRDSSVLVPNYRLNEATTSLPDQILATLSDTNSQFDASRERIQRSGSRPSYEQIKSEKKRRKSYRSGSAGRITRSRTSSGLHTDTLTSPRFSDAVDRSIRVSECHPPEGSVSLPHQTEAKLSDINSQLDNSLEVIHRCRSTQAIPVPLIQSEKKWRKSYRSGSAGRITRSRTSSGLHTDTLTSPRFSDAVDRSIRVSECHPPEGSVSLPHQTEAKLSDINSQLDNSLEVIHRCRSTQAIPVPLIQSEKKRRKSYRSGSAGRITRSRTSSGLHTDTLTSPRFSDAVDRSIRVSECHPPEGSVSLPRQTEAKLSDINSQLDNSLEVIHRCRSTQAIPVPLIQSEKKRKESCNSSISGRIKRLRTSSGLRTDTRAHKKLLNLGNSSMEVSECHQKEATSSPPYHTVARLSDNNLQIDNSVARIRRSSSWKKFPVPLTTAEGILGQKGNKSYKNAIASRITRSRTSSGLRTDARGAGNFFDDGDSSVLVSDCGLHKEIVSPPRKAEAGLSDVNSQLDNSLARIQRSRSRQKALVLRSVEVESEKRPFESQLQGDVNRDILKLDMDPLKISFGETPAQTLDVAEHQVEEICAGELEAEANKTHEIPSGDHVPEYTGSSDVGTRIISSQIVTPKSANIDSRSGSPYLLRNSMEPDNQDVISELHRHVQHELELNHVSISDDEEASHLNVNGRSVGKHSHCAKHHMTEGYGCTPSIETKEGDQEMEDRENGKNMSTERQLETSLVSRLKNDCENVQDYALESTDVNTSLPVSEGQTFPFPESVLSSQKMEKMGSVQDTESVIEDWLLSSSVKSLNFEDIVLKAADQSMPVFEGFSVDMPTEKILSFPGDRMGLGKVDPPSTISERISVLESPKNHTIPDVYPSTPNGSLDCTDMRDGVPLSNGGFKQLKSSYIFSSAEPDCAFLGCMPSSNVELDLGMTKPPCTPPVRMLGQRITSVPAHHSFGKSHSVNPELMCFRIDEDTSTSEENGALDEVAGTFHEDRSPRQSISEENETLDEVADTFHEDRSPCHSSFSNRIPLVDMTNSEYLMSISTSKTVHDRGSMNSVNTKPYMHRSQIKAKQNLRNTYGQGRGGRKDKENQKSLVSGNGVGNSSVKTRLSRKASSESQSFQGMGPKRGNIVSNVSSFVPLVQQKQKPAAFATGKRDVKVKALEAAEAAKRLEEKRENDRKLKKAAAKLKRARIEEAKMKQLELKQKKEVEERKKKESEMAARKRQREDDGRKENERKRKCIEDKKDHLKIRSDKVKDKRRQTADVRGKENMPTVAKTVKVAAESVAQSISEVSEIDKDSNQLVVSSLFNDDAKNRMLLLSEGNGEPSYDISPYQVSDDENEDDDEEEHLKRKKKFIPSWAREKSLASIMPYMEQVDQCKIFLPTRVCNIATVLAARNPR
ncbi:hypothetical protein ACHQM5_030031 [Ranunculus cassubicifolius]